ncbi:MAG: fructose-6-phosphate aldolase [Bilifractor sp.]
MEILIDTANVELIRRYNEILDLTGVTCNPTIIAKEHGDFWKILTEIRSIIGDRQLHVQVTAHDYEGMLKEADAITSRLGKEHTYIKVPVNETGVHVIRTLKQTGFHVTGTAIYMTQQAMLAASVGADYVAPYFNRIDNNNVRAGEVIADMVKLFHTSHVATKILAASFHNTQQIMDAFLAGAEACTAAPEYFTRMVENPLIEDAIRGFDRDWMSVYGEKTICEL